MPQFFSIVFNNIQDFILKTNIPINPLMELNKIRILIADQNVTVAKKLATYLQDSGFEVYALHDGVQMEQKILEIRPQFILIDLTLSDFSAMQCLNFIKDKELNKDGDMRVIVMSQHNAKQNVEACLKLGANDYIVKPVNPMDVLTRIALHIQARKKIVHYEEIQDLEMRQTNYYLNLVELFVKTIGVRTTPHQIHFQLLRMVALALNAVRVSLIQLDDNPTVIASSDNEKFTKFALQINKYPEIDYVQRTERALFIESIKDDAMMGFIKDQMKSVYFNSMIVLPIFNDGAIHGILSARLTESANLNEADIKLCQIAAQSISSYWHLHASAAKKISAA